MAVVVYLITPICTSYSSTGNDSTMPIAICLKLAKLRAPIEPDPSMTSMTSNGHADMLSITKQDTSITFNWLEERCHDIENWEKQHLTRQMHE